MLQANSCPIFKVRPSIDGEMSTADESMELFFKNFSRSVFTKKPLVLLRKNMKIIRKKAKINPKLSKLLKRL